MSSPDNNDNAAGPSDDVKRKFREALEKKNANARTREGEAHLDGESAVHSTHGPASSKREFRRKSG